MKTVLVSGASRGLGLAIARRLVAEGYYVIGTARSRSDAFVALADEYPDRCAFEPFDLSDIDGIHGFVNEVTQRHGGLYGLVNNAGLGLSGVLATMHNTQIEQVMRVNAFAPMVLAKYACRSMMLAREGRIVNISSIIAQTGFSGLTSYGASKAALEGFTRSLAREVGRAGIAVNAVAPGYMATEMTSALEGSQLDSIVRRSPFRELATVDDVAGAVAYLVGPDAGRITGTVLTVDAGSTA